MKSNYATKRSLLVLVVTGILTLSPFNTLTLFAAPAKGGAAAIPVAEGYPAWTGITPKNYICGRVLLSNAELRQRVTIVIEFDANKALEQIEKMGSLSTLNGFNELVGLGSANWESIQLPRDVLVIYVARNFTTADVVNNAFKKLDVTKYPGVNLFNASRAPVYANVTFEGAPSNGGKLPFVYVMGYKDKEPLYKAEGTAKGVRAAIRKAISDQSAKLTEEGVSWRQFYGYVAEPKHFKKDVEGALTKGKSLEPVEAKLLKGVVSKDPETAKEAQMLYDALEQTRSELVWTIECCHVACPHVAAYDLSVLLKYWPKTKKQMSATADKLKANGAAQPLIKMYPKVAQWANPEFRCKNASEAKKIVLELQKMKKTLEPLKEDKNVQVQNGALIVDGMLDELISTIPARIVTK